MSLVAITDNISYIPASEGPLSSDAVFIKTDEATWIFDVGTSKEARDAINGIEGKKYIVISHFHPDHTLNLVRVSKDKLYVSKNTKKYTLGGEEICGSVSFEVCPQITVLEFPSSHAKGCLCLVCGDYAFMGDGTYCKPVKGHHSYNAQLLKQMIDTMEKLNVKFFCLSHEKNFIQSKESVIALYKDIYKRRKPDSPIIDVEDFFTSNGKVKASNASNTKKEKKELQG